MKTNGKIILLKNQRALNPLNETLTVESLKRLSGLEAMTSEEAGQIIVEIKILSTILIDLLKSNEPQKDCIILNQAA